MIVPALLLISVGCAQEGPVPVGVPAAPLRAPLQAPLQAAPKVIERSLHGRAGLPVGETLTLSVTFDQDMRPGGYSFMRGGTPFPEIVGKPRYEGKRTAAVDVRLVKDTDYVVGIGRAAGGHFLAAATGVHAEPSQMVFSTRPWPLGRGDRAAALAALRACLPGRYSHAALVMVPWEKRIDARQEEILAARSALELGLIVQDLVAEAGDPHLYVSLGDHRFVPPSNWRVARAKAVPKKATRRNWNALGLTAQLSRLGVELPRTDPSEPIVLTITGEEVVGYVWIPDWNRGMAEAVTTKMRACGSLRRWIVDVRSNSGGDEREAMGVAGLFVDEPVVYAKRRSLDAAGQFEPMRDALLKPSPRQSAMPHLAESDVVVLMGPDTMSASEAFCLMMRAGPAALAGEATFGGSGNPKPLPLAPGVTLMVPSWIGFDAQGRAIERRGIEADFTLPFPEDHRAVRNEDPIFQWALEMIQR